MNTNEVNLAELKGEIKICPFCKNSGLPLSMRSHCKFCLTNGYVAKCLKCEGSGLVGGGDVWGGGSDLKSPCLICGGVGTMPSRAPVEPAVVVQAVSPVSVTEEVLTQE